ncbi:hypothetical protein CASFOL_024777 [Castilleja foliolosa]|uniref:NAC domain-containing protein n=1 Tax=Castilleja foliolosa TaxID=1961234 RepID=A0ABD3CP98_9LAMI
MGFRYLLKKIGKKRRICRNNKGQKSGKNNMIKRCFRYETKKKEEDRNCKWLLKEYTGSRNVDDLITSSNCTSTSRGLDLNLAVVPLPPIDDDVRDEDLIVDLNLAVPLPPIDDDVRDEDVIVDLNLAVPLPIDDVRDEDLIFDLNLAVPMPEAEAESEPVNAEPEPVEEDDGFDFSMMLDDDLSWDFQFSLAGIPMDLLDTVWT